MGEGSENSELGGYVLGRLYVISRRVTYKSVHIASSTTFSNFRGEINSPSGVLSLTHVTLLAIVEIHMGILFKTKTIEPCLHINRSVCGCLVFK